jgi:hypothetical protein
LIVLSLRGQGGPAWVEGKGQQRQEDADGAKRKTEQDAWIKKAGSRRTVFFNKFFLSLFRVGTTRYSCHEVIQAAKR